MKVRHFPLNGTRLSRLLYQVEMKKKFAMICFGNGSFKNQCSLIYQIDKYCTLDDYALTTAFSLPFNKTKLKMRQTFPLFSNRILFLLVMIAAISMSCNNPQVDTTKQTTSDSVATNIKMYSHVWDEIINNRKLEMFNDSNFTQNLVLHAGPSDVVGIDSARAYYANYLTGFSDVTFTVKDVFGMDNRLVKHWNFKGNHTGVFFGIPATNKKVDIDGVTLVRMENGKIAEERDFLDNLEFMQQLELIPR